MDDILQSLCLNKDYADIEFIVEDESVPAHRCILASSSEYFRALLYGSFAEADKNRKKIELDANLGAFKKLMLYIYTGDSHTSASTLNENIELLKIAHEYGYKNLLSKISSHLISILSHANYAAIMNNAKLFDLKTLYDRGLKYADDNSKLVIKAFNSFSKEVLFDTIGRDSFSINELDIFNAVIEWGEEQTAEDLKFVLCNVRFHLMQIRELREIVAPTGVLKPDQIDDIVADIKNLSKLPFRNGEIHRNQLKVSQEAIAILAGYKFLQSLSGMFLLPDERMVNYIQFRILDDYIISYYVEISFNKREWTRVIDYREYECRGFQNLFFDAIKTRCIYICIQGIAKAANHICNLEVDLQYDTFPPKILDGVSAFTQSNDSGIKLFGSTYVELWFRQPKYINNMITTYLFSLENMPILKSKAKGDLYEEIEYHIHPNGKWIYFNAHIAISIRLYFKDFEIDPIRNAHFCCFFNSAPPSAVGIEM